MNVSIFYSNGPTSLLLTNDSYWKTSITAMRCSLNRLLSIWNGIQIVSLVSSIQHTLNYCVVVVVCHLQCWTQTLSGCWGGIHHSGL